MEDGFHDPIDEYLSAVYELEEEGVTPIQARLAERLGYSAAAVSGMVGRMVEDGWVHIDARRVTMSDRGRARAVRVVRKHRLAERLLNDVIGLEWAKTHMEAGRWEHVISDEVEALLITLLGDPATCPHGNPIPGAVTEPGPAPAVPLSTMSQGDVVEVARIMERVELDPSLLGLMETHRIRPGTAAVVRERTLDGSMMLEIDGRPFALGPDLAESIFVSRVEAHR